MDRAEHAPYGTAVNEAASFASAMVLRAVYEHLDTWARTKLYVGQERDRVWHSGTASLGSGS